MRHRVNAWYAFLEFKESQLSRDLQGDFILYSFRVKTTFLSDGPIIVLLLCKRGAWITSKEGRVKHLGRRLLHNTFPAHRLGLNPSSYSSTALKKLFKVQTQCNNFLIGLKSHMTQKYKVISKGVDGGVSRSHPPQSKHLSFLGAFSGFSKHNFKWMCLRIRHRPNPFDVWVQIGNSESSKWGNSSASLPKAQFLSLDGQEG